MTLIHGDCLEELKKIPDATVDLVLTDPPYNIGKAAWDKIDGYVDWCIEWLLECQRVLKPNGVLYFWHNDMAQIAELLQAIRKRTNLAFISFCIWDKGDTYRAKSWKQRDPDGKTALRSWFNVCEYCLHFFNAPKDAEASWKHTGLDKIKSDPECWKPLKDWVAAEKERLGLTDADIAKRYTEATGRKPHMLRHYFRDSQFEIPTRRVWESVYIPLGFSKSYEELRQSYEELRQSYEELRQSYEDKRNVHNCDAMHCNVWHIPPIPSVNRYHICQKPVEILERLIHVSTNGGGASWIALWAAAPPASPARTRGATSSESKRTPNASRLQNPALSKKRIPDLFPGRGFSHAAILFVQVVHTKCSRPPQPVVCTPTLTVKVPSAWA